VSSANEPISVEMLPTLYFTAGLFNSILENKSYSKKSRSSKTKQTRKQADFDSSLPGKGAGCSLSQLCENHGLYGCSTNEINGM